MTSPHRGLTVLIVALIVLAGLYAAQRRDPWDPDETRCLQVTQELLGRGNPFLLTFNGDPYTDKPPLYFWILAPLVAAFGPHSAVVSILPSLLAIIGLTVAVERLGRTMGLSASAARWAPILLVTSLLPAVSSAGCRMDLLFALWSTLALEQWVALCGDSPPTPKSHLLLWLWITCGVLTKGPLALAFPLVAALALLPRDNEPLKRLFIGPGPLVAISVMTLWLVPAVLAGGLQWIESSILHQTLARAVSSFAHREPWWYHIATLPLTLLPWTPAVVLATAAAYGHRSSLSRRARLVAIYPVSGLAFLSLLSGKTFLYPLPLFPPACLLAAWWLNHTPNGPTRRLALVAGAASLVVIAVGLYLVVSPHPDIAHTPVTRCLLAASAAIPAVTAIGMASARNTHAAMLALSFAVPLFMAAGLQTLVKPFNRLLSVRPIAEAYLESDKDRGSHGVAFDRPLAGLLLFSGRPFLSVTEPEELQLALARGHTAVINRKAANRLIEENGVRFETLAEVPYRHTTYLIISHRSCGEK